MIPAFSGTVLTGTLRRFAVFAAVALALAFAAWQQGSGRTDTPASHDAVAGGSGVGGPFSLTDHNGNAVTEKDYAQSWKLVFFGFTHCPDVCPAGLQKIKTVLETLPPGQAEKLAVLFVTVDPARDTPEVMKAYAGLYDSRITGLTGTEEQVKAMENAYKVYAARSEPAAPESAHEAHETGAHHEGAAHHSASYSVDHSAFIYFMSPEGKLVDIFHSDDTPDAILKALDKTLPQS